MPTPQDSAMQDTLLTIDEVVDAWELRLCDPNVDTYEEFKKTLRLVVQVEIRSHVAAAEKATRETIRERLKGII